MNKRTYGLELEKPLSDKSSQLPHGVSQAFFTRLEEEAKQRRQTPHRHLSDIDSSLTVGIMTDDLGEQGLDNGTNLQETALPYTTDLQKLYEKMVLDIKSVQKALEEENATTINMSIHPLGSTDNETYRKFVAPKSLYKYITRRKWTHSAGIDAKAQNSPATGVTVDEAADAVSVNIGFGAAIMGIFGNGPFAEGKASGFKETRATLWDHMFGSSVSKGDLFVSKYPEKRFFSLAEYFSTLFGEGTNIHFVLAGGQNYKSLGDRVLLVEDSPSTLEYLSRPSWKARYLYDILENKAIEPIAITPHISHLEAVQWAPFVGARVRFGVEGNEFPILGFVEACKKTGSRDVEEIFKKYSKFTYIEARDPGANFPDAEITAAGDEIAKSVAIAPSALQAGLIQNLSEAVKLLEKYDWTLLGKLRDAAIKDGLTGEVDGVRVKDLAEKVVEVASRGLKPTETWMLSYPEWVLRTGKNGADRALDFVNSHEKGGRQAIIDLVKSRVIDLTSYEN